MGKDLAKATDAATLTRKKCNELLKRAHGGDNAALTDLRRLLNETPDLWNDLGNIAMQAERLWIGCRGGVVAKDVGPDPRTVRTLPDDTGTSGRGAGGDVLVSPPLFGPDGCTWRKGQRATTG